MKKRFKRIFAFVAMMILVVTMVIPMSAINSLAVSNFTVVITASKTDLQPGDSFDVTITLNNIPGTLKSGSIDIPADPNYIDTTTGQYSYVKATGNNVTSNNGTWNSTAGAFRCAIADQNGYVTGPSLVLGKFVIKVKSTVTPPASTGLGWAGNLIRIVSTAPFKDTNNVVQTATFDPTNIPLNIIANPADQNAANAVITQINALPAVGSLVLADKTAVTDVRVAYDVLTAFQKSLVSNYATLTAAETKIATLEATIVDQAAADAVIAKIDLIPEASSLTLFDKPTVSDARTAYDALTAAQQALVTNYANLTAAETKLLLLFDKEEAGAVVSRINAIPALASLTLADTLMVTAARAAYDVLTSTQKALVENYATLTAAETKIAELQTAADNQVAADAVIAKINLIPALASLTLANETTVTDARTAYNALTTQAQKGLVTNYANLTAAEAKIADLKTAAANQAAADAVKAKINLIPAVGSLTLADKTKVTEARTAYDALTSTQKALVTNLATLTVAETKIAELEVVAADQTAANVVIAKINSIPAVGSIALTDKSKVTEARVAYNALTSEQKALVTNLATLTVAETKIADLEVASTVITKITAIPALSSLTLANKATVETARTAYGALTATQKTYVTNYATLTAAETKIADLTVADAVITKINLIPALASLTLADKTKVTDARTAYDGLTATQKTYITTYATLTAAETKIADLEAASAVIAKINLIPALASLTLADKTKVTDARTAYNALTSAQKAYITNYATLTEAETVMAGLVVSVTGIELNSNDVAYVAAGGYYELSVNITEFNNNPYGIAAFEADLLYDSSIFEMAYLSDLSLTNESFKVGSIIHITDDLSASLIAPGKIKILYVDSNGGTTNTHIQDLGNMCKIRFRVKSSIVVGEYAFSLKNVIAVSSVAVETTTAVTNTSVTIYNPHKVSGIADNGVYNTEKTISIENGTATLGGNKFISGSTVTADGVYTLVVTDYANESFEYTFTIDTTPPADANFTASITELTNKDIEISISFPVDAVVKQYSLDNINWFDYTVSFMIGSNLTVYAKSQDSVGNWSGISSYTISNIDKVAPIITINDYETNPTNQDIIVIATTNEGQMNLIGYKFTENGSITFFATDAAGNVSKRTITIKNIDKIAPTVFNLSDNELYTEQKTIEFDEGIATLNKLVITSGTLVTQTGDYILEVKDAAGNVTLIHFTVCITAKFTLTNGNIYNIGERSSVSAIKAGFALSGQSDIIIKRPDGTLINESEYIGTGMKVCITVGGVVKKEYTVVILGDASGDGMINAIDLLLIKRSILGITPLTDVYSEAANIDRDTNNAITAIDLLRLKRYILGLDNLA